MNESELKYCPECGTKTLEIEFGFNKVHCAECGKFFTLMFDTNSITRKGYLLKNEKSLDPNDGKSAFQIATQNPGAFSFRSGKDRRGRNI